MRNYAHTLCGKCACMGAFYGFSYQSSAVFTSFSVVCTAPTLRWPYNAEENFRMKKFIIFNVNGVHHHGNPLCQHNTPSDLRVETESHTQVYHDRPVLRCRPTVIGRAYGTDNLSPAYGRNGHLAFKYRFRRQKLSVR